MIYLLGSVILTIASFVIYASVTGIGSMFQQTAVPVMIAWTGVEVGKYVAMSYAYRYRQALSRMNLVLLSVFVAIIMAFTSVGVFAYLGQSYQGVTNTVDKNEALRESKQRLAAELGTRIEQINKQVADLPSNVVKNRIVLIQQYDEEKKPLVAQRTALLAEVEQLSGSRIDLDAHTGTILFVAKTLGVQVSTAVVYAIAVITLCLDPFAMFLSVVLNRMLVWRKDNPEPEAERTGGWFANRRWSAEHIRDQKIQAEMPTDGLEWRTRTESTERTGNDTDAAYEAFGFDRSSMPYMVRDLSDWKFNGADRLDNTDLNALLDEAIDAATADLNLLRKATEPVKTPKKPAAAKRVRAPAKKRPTLKKTPVVAPVAPATEVVPAVNSVEIETESITTVGQGRTIRPVINELP